MAIDTSRVNLELASGRGEVTAPFHHTARRKRSTSEEAAPADASAEPRVASQVMVDVPLAAAAPLPEIPPNKPSIAARSHIARPSWIAFIAAILAVAGAVWWIMFQRLPDVDLREVIERNLSDARLAMAEGRYTDPAERSALHYYSTVLTLDPGNVNAIAGIDAIADRHITDARVLLAEQRIAEAGVALEMARRVRPNHTALIVLDTQLRIELRKMLAAATSVPVETPPAKPQIAKASDAPTTHSAPIRRDNEAARQPKVATFPRAAARSAKVATEQPVPLPITLDEAALERITLAKVAKAAKASAAANGTAAQPSAPNSAPAHSTPDIRASINDSSPATAPPASLPERAPDPVVGSAEPKLIKMVQPEYPQEALMRGIEGWVDISLQVTAAGDVIEPRVEEASRNRIFNRAALRAVQQWKYEPRADGAPTERVRVRVRFQQTN